MLCLICMYSTGPTQETCATEDHAGYTPRTRQHELRRSYRSRKHICPACQIIQIMNCCAVAGIDHTDHPSNVCNILTTDQHNSYRYYKHTYVVPYEYKNQLLIVSLLLNNSRGRVSVTVINLCALWWIPIRRSVGRSVVRSIQPSRTGSPFLAAVNNKKLLVFARN